MNLANNANAAADRIFGLRIKEKTKKNYHQCIKKIVQYLCKLE
jgi:hypothetical protein